MLFEAIDCGGAATWQEVRAYDAHRNRRPSSNEAQSADTKQKLQQPDTTEVSADHEAVHPREPIQPTHDDAGQ